MKIETHKFQNYEVTLVKDDEQYLTYWILGGQKVELFSMSSEDWDN
ncbi:hypothetical protein [Synechococcus elongatus]|uniref:Uncharacterized protein n=1 Tax=Synechococcus elongatus PCC 11802 TaxID=2283154 RepID=A0AAU6R4Q4_SYNEL|nr:hypothetical protein [Synechococcus elongatus]